MNDIFDRGYYSISRKRLSKIKGQPFQIFLSLKHFFVYELSGSVRFSFNFASRIGFTKRASRLKFF